MNDISEKRPSKDEKLAVRPSISVQEMKEGADQLRNEDGSLTLIYSEKNYLEYRVEDWEKYLSGHIPGFRGNLRNAAMLLLGFTKGVNETCRDKAIKKTLPFALVSSEEVINSPFISNDEYGFLLRLSQLERDSLDINSPTVIQRKTGEIIFEGVMGDFYMLVGAEESHHNWFRRQKQEYVYPTKKPTEYSVEEYDSQEIEFQALEWQLKLAISESMQDSTIRLLQNRYDKAKEYRGKKKDK